MAADLRDHPPLAIDQLKRCDQPNLSTPKLLGSPYAVTREFFLRGLSLCYFVAFASFLLQVPGLYGPQGLLPARAPSRMEYHCLCGMALGVLGFCGLGCMPVMWGMLRLYVALVHTAPPPFYNFQWDILLLETGFLGALLAPLLHSSLEPRPSRATLWLLRFVLFKLMLMSGVVKITEGDDSWKQLTAIWYHFATQCIPTPLAWFFHNLPLPLEKLFCACCFAIEIPAAFLILVPVWHVQVLAAFLQISLQIIIILTGNYTFFNYLTILLACTLLDRDIVPPCCRAMQSTTLPRSVKHEDEHWESGEATADTTPLLGMPAAGPGVPLGADGSRVNSAATALSAAAEAVAAAGSAEKALQAKAVASLGLPVQQSLSVLRWGCLAFCTLVVLLFSSHLGLNRQLALQLSSEELLEWTSRWVPRALVFLSIVIPVVTLFDVVDAVCADEVQLQGLGRHGRVALGVVAAVLLLIRGVLCQHWLALAPGVLEEVAPSLGEPTTRVSLWHAGLPAQGGGVPVMPFGLPHYGPYRYGLFRAMTGIGPFGEVARPEIVLAVQESTSGAWHELQFRYKPGDVHRRPPLVAPYQPRLDWQMWFQALESFPEIWFDRLFSRVLEGSPAVLSLLDVGSLPDVEISAVRAMFYTYNFTRYGQSGWWRRELVDSEFYGPQAASEPLNLVHAVAVQPIDWRPIAVWCLFAVAVLRWLLPPGIQWGFAYWDRRARVNTPDSERKED